jgi:phage baseplate assembly protein W
MVDMTDLPHFVLPFQWSTAPGGGLQAAVAEQESITEIGGCCEAIIRTVQGQRTTLPEFGIPQVEFNGNPELTQTLIAAALLEWEPRVSSFVSATTDLDDETTQIVRALIGPADDQEGEQI